MGVNIREGAASSGSRYDNAVDLPMEKIELSSKNTVINMPVFPGGSVLRMAGCHQIHEN